MPLFLWIKRAFKLQNVNTKFGKKRFPHHRIFTYPRQKERWSAMMFLRKSAPGLIAAPNSSGLK